MSVHGLKCGPVGRLQENTAFQTEAGPGGGVVKENDSNVDFNSTSMETILGFASLGGWLLSRNVEGWSARWLVGGWAPGLFLLTPYRLWNFNLPCQCMPQLCSSHVLAVEHDLRQKCADMVVLCQIADFCYSLLRLR